MPPVDILETHAYEHDSNLSRINHDMATKSKRALLQEPDQKLLLLQLFPPVKHPPSLIDNLPQSLERRDVVSVPLLFPAHLETPPAQGAIAREDGTGPGEEPGDGSRRRGGQVVVICD